MNLIKCMKCGNTNNFYEISVVKQVNYFEQEKNGYINKIGVKENDYDMDSRIFCNICNQEISEDYHLLLDRYSDSPLKTL
ncbi:MAG: hypothetical protein V1709_07680 [Planctomycetota bacterium]